MSKPITETEEPKPLTKDQRKIIAYLRAKGIKSEWQLRQVTLGLKIIYDATHQPE
jgi:hypothetical protein